uniref:Tensin 2 n=1 Tax=Sarcophilus harrisii TaxID=9305 RepID=A0A7N4PHI9_SARHA
MKSSSPVERLLRALGRRDSARAVCRPGKAEPHSFREKVFRKKPPACTACKVTVEGTGLVCRGESGRGGEGRETQSKFFSHQGSTKSLNHSKQRSTLPRSFSLDPLMERRWDLDLTYVTERILAAAFPGRFDEQRHRSHLRELAHVLQSKHRDNYLVRDTAVPGRVQDFGWPDLHAPPLDKLCSICKAMENWLSSSPQHVVVLYCKGNKAKLGVIVAAYMHYSKISASEDQALATLTMRKFCEDKVASEFQPSQRRYISYFSGLLSGSIRMNSSPLFLHHVLMPVLPAFEPGTGYQPFLKIYQSMQLVYTSGVYHISNPGPQQLCISLEPALLLKGDVLVTCYHKGGRESERTLVFRVQFHTCTIHGSHLTFSKDQLDEAWTDERFPFQASVEFVFSSGPEKIKGREPPRNDASVSVDYNTTDSAVRWDSYENFNQHHEDSGDGMRARPHLGRSWRPQTQPPLPLPPVPPRRGPGPAVLSGPRPPGHQHPPAAPVTVTGPLAPRAGRSPRAPPPRGSRNRLLGLGISGVGVGGAILGGRKLPGGAPSGPGRGRAWSACSCRHARTLGAPRALPAGGAGRRPARGPRPPGRGAALEKRPLCRSLSEGPYPYPPKLGKQAHGELGFRLPGYRDVVLLGRGLQRCAPAASREMAARPPFPSPGEGRARPRAGKPLLHPLRGRPRSCCRLGTSQPLPIPCRSPQGRRGRRGAPPLCPGVGHPYPSWRARPGFGADPPPAGPARKPLLPAAAAAGQADRPGDGWFCARFPFFHCALPSADSPEPGLWQEGPGGHVALPRAAPNAQGVESAPSDLSGSPTPLHTSSPVQGKESPQNQENRSPSLAPALRLGPGDGARTTAQGNVEKPPELPSAAGKDPPGSGPFHSASPSGSPRDWAQERGQGVYPGSAHPRVPVPTTLPGLRHATWQGPHVPSDSPDGSPLTPVPAQMPWLVPAPEPPQCSPTPAFPLAASYDSNGTVQPPLPEKRHPPAGGQQAGRPWGGERASPPGRGATHHVTFAPLLLDEDPNPSPQESQSNVKFVQDTSKFWYKPHLSRDQAISLLKDKEPGAFLIRDSHSFQGAYGLALKVATPPPSAQACKGDPLEQLVRHFLIETGPKGVKIKGCPSEPHFGSLSALVSQHSIAPISLPCCLRIPSKDPLDKTPEVSVHTNMSTASDLLRQGAACSVLYLTSVETESLTGPQAVARASSSALSCSPSPTPITVHFKVSAQGITLTDNHRKLFFRRHYPVNSITFCSTDPQDRRWTNTDGTTSKIFGFVARKPGSPWENVCHLFSELDPDQPAVAIVTFITKVLLGQRK